MPQIYSDALFVSVSTKKALRPEINSPKNTRFAQKMQIE
jgi:hypothetical protein